MSLQIVDSMVVPYNLALRIVKTAITTGTPTTSTWSVYVQDLSHVSDGTQVTGAPTAPDDPGTWGTAIGSLTFGSDGKLLSTSSQPNAAAGDPLSLALNLNAYPLDRKSTRLNSSQ